jgi:hypothetical protein
MKAKDCLFVFTLAAAALFFSCEQGMGGTGSGDENEFEIEEEKEAQLIGVKITSKPEITVYGRNQTFDRTGLEVGWLYDDDSTVPMEDGEWLIVSEPDMTDYTMHEVTVKAADRGDDENYQDSFWIAVMDSDEVLQYITVSGPSNKIQDIGFEFDKTGLVVTGHFSGGGGTSTRTLTSYASILGYNRKWRGEQALTAKVNGKTAAFAVTTRIGAKAHLTINKVQWLHEDYQNTRYRPTRIKGEGLNPATANIQLKVYPNGYYDYSATNVVTLSYGPGGLADADFTGAISAYNPNKTGVHQSVPFSVDGKTLELDIYVVDAEPDVWFDYGYMRHAGDATGHGPGAGKYYAKPNETLVIAPVRFLVGYNADHSTASGTTYQWTVPTGCTYTTSNGGELLHVTPGTAGNYAISVKVTGKNYLTGANIEKTASTELVCYSSGLSAGTFVSPLRNFACGQFSEGGSGLGWSLGSAGGYEVWTVEHRPSYIINGNAFSAWHEAGIVWAQEDNNKNGLPDEMWYELRGGDDDDPAWKNYITRRYAVTYVKASEHGTVNEYGQLIREVYWADSRGRSHMIPGGFPDKYWGVSGSRVTYTMTLLRDDGKIATSDYGGLLFTSGGYVDALSNTYHVKDAMRADGTKIALSAVKFIKVQTAVFRYGGDFGDVSTEIHSADFLGSQTDFPLP